MIDFNIDNYLRISFTDVVLVCISTLLIVLFAKHFFWNKLVAFVKKRQDLIQENIDASITLKEEASQIKAQYDEKMKHAGQEAHALIESAKEQANQEKAEILAQASTQADRLKDAAKEEIDREKRKAEADMKNAISDVAIEVARNLVHKEVDETVQQAYVEDFLKQAERSEW
ncbi:F0F1 ATP synthase subunit B [Dubosiella newyorkensis]|jgi:F-type H+-transporting ATPase subunit b|uniref:F0F1 ATP synthase subunit B n=1 Tax=Dubosiella newyorkensis TaxID=1862672 RepID=UPI0009F950D5|nr:F0F1 ATP synthase subunit B [Dubosiella newyorkensis]MCI9041269.1 F0F1 ATP synthase subunit B [Dubosiella newyorkensis]